MANQQHHSVSSGVVMERTLFRTLVGLSLIASLFYFANKAFNNVIDDVVESKYDWVAERFTLSIGHIHKEWVFKNKPSVVRLTYFLSATETTDIVVQVNKTGWPLNVASKDRQLNCLNLWMLFAHEEGHRKSILDLTSHLEIETKAAGCEYYYLDKGLSSLIFSYNVVSGKVSAFGLD